MRRPGVRIPLPPVFRSRRSGEQRLSRRGLHYATTSIPLPKTLTYDTEIRGHRNFGSWSSDYLLWPTRGTPSGKLLVRYLASWPKRNSERGEVTISVGLFSGNEAFASLGARDCES